MLVIKDRYHLRILLKCFCNLFEETLARIEVLSFGIGRIVPMLSDAQYTVDCYPTCSQANGLFNRRGDGKSKFLCYAASEVILGELIDIKGCKFQLGAIASVLLPAFQDLANQYFGMRVLTVDGDDRCYSLLSNWLYHGVRREEFDCGAEGRERRKQRRTGEKSSAIRSSRFVLHEGSLSDRG